LHFVTVLAARYARLRKNSANPSPSAQERASQVKSMLAGRAFARLFYRE
jgi:hypothetical protein